VAGFKAWLKLGYCVRKGEKAIRIVAPMPIKDRDADGDDETQIRVLFKGVSVFDRQQVAPIDGAEQASLEPPCEPLTGDSHAHLLEPLAAFARSFGFDVSFESIRGSAGGSCDRQAKWIVVDAGAPANAQLRTLIHETIHARSRLCRVWPRARRGDRGRRDLAGGVERRIGRRGESIPYVAGWGEDGALEAVTDFAKTIDGLARQVEDVLRAASVPEAAAL
jgi:hypothetical protein